MSVIAWDGRTLAADRQATQAGLARICEKIWRCERTGDLLGAVGQPDTSAAMRAWYEAGASVDTFPACNRNEGVASHLYVVRLDGTCVKYEGEPYPIPIVEIFWAAGSGRDYALGAMACGMPASFAVVIASRFDVSCGMGVNILTLEEEVRR